MASWAETGLPVRIMSRALLIPIKRGSLTVPLILDPRGENRSQCIGLRTSKFFCNLAEVFWFHEVCVVYAIKCSIEECVVCGSGCVGEHASNV